MWLVLPLLMACRSPPGGPTGDSGGDTGSWQPASGDWCGRVAPGAAGEDVVLGLSAAHATHRLFGVDGELSALDARLAAALGAPGALVDPDLAAYVDGAVGVCLADALPPSPDPTIRTVGQTVIYSPASDLAAVPRDAAAYALDLRGLSPTPALEEQLAAAVALVLDQPLPRPDRRVRVWSGLVDQYWSSSNAYATSREVIEREAWAAGAAASAPLAVLVDAQMAPLAAELAMALRLEGRAWLVGESVLAEVAEADWAAVGARGLSMRTRGLQRDGDLLPDEVPADVPTGQPDEAVGDLATWGAPPALDLPEGQREPVRNLEPWGDGGEPTLGLGEARAALVVAHGGLRRFYPYFDVVGDHVDARLAEVLEAVGEDAPDRVSQKDHLGRLGNAIADGHMFVWDLAAESDSGCLGADFDLLEGEVVVEHSEITALQPGDAIEAIDGQPVQQWLDAALAVVGGATEGYAFNLASRRLQPMEAARSFTVEDVTGVVRELVVEPSDCSLYAALPWGWTSRPSGWLDDLGAPDLYYLNYDGAVTSEDAQWQAALAEAEDAAGLVVDMRGYPGTNHYSLAQALWTEDFSSPLFGVPTWTGPDTLERVQSSYAFAGTDLAPRPIALLVGPRTVSAAENLSMMLVDLPDLSVVGRRSAGTNGNITGMQLPGGYVMSFTGMDVRFPDGSTFHSVGIEPDVEVVPTRADWAAGRDPELEAAVDLLR